MSKVRAEHLLPLACAAACAMLAASEFMNTFEFDSGGANTRVEQPASDQHHYALVVLAGFALVSLMIAVVAGSKPAAAAVAICGAAALVIFLLIDLPDAGRVDTIDSVDFTEAKAEPATGFWLELVGAIMLAACGAALATFSPEQLRTFVRSAEGRRPSSRRQPTRRPRANPTAKASAKGKQPSAEGEQPSAEGEQALAKGGRAGTRKQRPAKTKPR